MKQLLILFAFLGQFSIFAQSEEENIRKIIEAETSTYHTNPDRSVFLSYWNISKESIMTYSGNCNVVMLNALQMEDSVKKGLIAAPDGISVSYENFIIKVSGNIAWASFIQVDTNKDGTQGPRLQEFRLLEKINGVWKISASSVHELKK